MFQKDIRYLIELILKTRYKRLSMSNYLAQKHYSKELLQN